MKKCEECGLEFEESKKHPKQKYCTREECKKKRKRKWQKKKRAEDADYAADQQDSQKRWVLKRPDYWKEYRKKNPAYTKANREKQKIRNRLKRIGITESSTKKIAKMDVEKVKKGITKGGYCLVLREKFISMIAKMDVESSYFPVISIGWIESSNDCKEETCFKSC